MHGLTQLGLGLASLALALGPGERARELLAKGEDLLARGSVSHNHLEFRMLAIDVHLGAHDWAGVAAQADALEEYTRDEALPWADLVIRRARALVEAAQRPGGPKLRRRLRALNDEAMRMEFAALVPRLRAASS